ncbi:MAG: hypothetical protein Q9195_005408 [Heterodermia aff. obscurata]
MDLMIIPTKWQQIEGQPTGSKLLARSQGAFVLKKTEVSIKSASAEDFNDDQSSGQASTCSTIIADETRTSRSLMSKLGRQNEELRSTWRSSEDLAQTFDAIQFGTTVSIEATQPVKTREQQFHEMKGLQQAASMKRWAGEGRPAEAWGKLIKDPELWDYTGDTLVYFGYQRPQASFRINASLLEATKSEILCSKLEEGFQRTAKLSRDYGHMSALRDMKNPSLATRGCRQIPVLSGDCMPAGENAIRHEIHFPAPENASRSDIIRHHITTRNFFALLLSKSLVGLTYYQALTDLHERLNLYLPRDVNCSQMIIRHLVKNDLHNVSNDPVAAVGLLAWSENPEVRWEEGWREAFVHCVGMYNEIQGLPETRDIGVASRALLKRSHLELKARIEDCETRLLAFNFDDIWLTSVSPLALARRSFDRFRHFVRQYYERAYKGWPPRERDINDKNWLTRKLIQRLRSDFGCLYEYYVDRTRSWDKAAEKSFDEKGSGEDFSLTKLFLFFDKKHKYPHMPYPYPLLPASEASLIEGKQPKSGLFSTKAKAMKKMIINASVKASNCGNLSAEIITNNFLEAFIRFERSDLISEMNPREIRKGHWILLYGILQVLSTLSVDTPHLWFKDVPYFVNPCFKDNPPWRYDTEKLSEEASQKLGCCWTVSNDRGACD